MSVKRTVGLAMLWLGSAYMVVIGWGAGWSFAATFRDRTLAEVNETVWAMSGPLVWAWVFSVPAGALIAGIGLLLIVNAKASHVWVFGLGVLAVQFVAWKLGGISHIPPALGVFGGLILSCFLLILWLWSKKRKNLEGRAATAADLQLAGYVLLIMAMWQTCGMMAFPYYRALSSLDPANPISLIVLLGLGWVLLFLSHYVESKTTASTD